jgi:hypothetical protein
MVEGVERLRNTLQTEALRKGKGSAQTGIQSEEIEANTGVAFDDSSG